MNPYTQKQKNLVKKLEASFTRGNKKISTVPILSDYKNDTDLCFTSVVFLPPKLARKIKKEIIEPLQALEPEHYFYPAASLHNTIKNIRTTKHTQGAGDSALFTKKDIAKVNILFQKLIPESPSFEFSLEGIVTFPTSLSIIGYTDETLGKLVKKLDQGLRNIGVPDNKKYLSNSVFWGNITICRFVHPPGKELQKAIKKLRKIKVEKFTVQQVELITCNAVCYPKSRTVFGQYKLKK